MGEPVDTGNRYNGRAGIRGKQSVWARKLGIFIDLAAIGMLAAGVHLIFTGNTLSDAILELAGIGLLTGLMSLALEDEDGFIKK